MNHWRKLTLAIAALVILVGPLSGAASLRAAAAPLRAQPALLQLVAAQPEGVVAVIVQKANTSGAAEALVARLGGTITKDLHIINAFAAQLPARQVTQLARASGVRWVSLDAPVAEAGGPDGTVYTASLLSAGSLLNAYNYAVRADQVWAEGYQGSSVTVAVVDSGMNPHNDIKTRILAKVKRNSYPATTGDNYGHGTHVAGIIGGNGSNSSGKYIGIAPKVKLVNVKVTDENGQALTSDVVNGLQWVLDNKATYNIRVMSLSLNSSVAESYHTSALDAALEILWFNQIVVVVSGGNNGASNPGILYPPANDPFVISVGATDDRGTATTTDDVLAAFSAFGTTESGFDKPDLVAPGTNIISLLSSSGSVLSTAHPDHLVSGASTYFRMSGTSMSAPMVAGAVALLLQDEPGLTPDQVKYRLKAAAQSFSAGNGAGYLDIYAAVYGTTTQSANTGIPASQLLWNGSDPVNWDSVNWNSVNWNAVNWNAVNWNAVNWNAVNWNADYWEP